MAGDRERARGRINTALDTLRKQEAVGLDADRLGAIGFCFGGAMVLELARSGTGLGGVVSFHGSLDTSMPAEAGAVRAPGEGLAEAQGWQRSSDLYRSVT